MLIVLGFIVLLLIVWTIKGVVIINQAETMVIERLGRFDRVLEAGINIIWPIIEKAQVIDWKEVIEGENGEHITRGKRIRRIDLRETVYDFPRQNVITKDNVVIQINAMLYFQVTDPQKAVYEINNLPNAIEKLTQTTLRNVIGEMELDETLSSRDQINDKLKLILDKATDKWGVKVNRVELQDIDPPQDIKAAMEKQMRAERDRRAAVTKAEGEKRASILKAEGERESAVLAAEGKKKAQILHAEAEKESRLKVAEGEAEAIKRIIDALGAENTQPSQYLLGIKYIEAFKNMAKNGNKIVYMPYEASGVLSSVGGIKELFKESDL
ncbi:MAG: SPFH domain-containing protein [bacterium]